MMIRKVIICFIILAALLIMLFPIYWMFSLSFRPLAEYFTDVPIFFSRNFTLRAYFEMFSLTMVGRYLWNSIIVAICSTLITIIVGVCGGYALARFSFPGKTPYVSSLLITQMFPAILLVIPLLQIIRLVGLFDTYYALIITYIAFCTPFSVWILKGYIETIPIEMEEAARVDGCSTLNLIVRIVFPVIMPGVVTMAIYTFLHAWGDFVFALTLVGKEEMKTLPIGLAMCFGEFETDWGLVMAMSVIYTLPPLLIFLFLQRYIIKGLTAGAVKM